METIEMNTSDSTKTLTLFDQCAGHQPAKFGVWEAPVFRLELVKERTLSAPVITSPADVAALLAGYLGRCDREHFVVVMLSAANQVIGISTVSVGSLTATIVNARETFKAAILANARSIVVAHNHPSGNLEPSREDVAVSKGLADAGKLLDIPILDSLIIGHDGRYTSLVERGLLN